MLGKNLDGGRAIEPRIPRPIDLTHATIAKSKHLIGERPARVFKLKSNRGHVNLPKTVLRFLLAPVPNQGGPPYH